MSIGYAEISGTIINITGTVEATAQEGVFIVDVNKESGDTTNSKIDYFIGTTLDSTVVLGSLPDSSITYEVTLYNNSNKDYVFIGVITDQNEENLYSNKNIEFILDENKTDEEKIKEYSTIITPSGTLKFTITFKYKDKTNITNDTLISKLNFRFQEAPKLVLSNEGKTYELNNIYPDYTSQEYKFSVSNYYSEEEINAVPMQYSFEMEIDSPYTGIIYDENGDELTTAINIEGDGQTLITHNYTLKIIWDNSNPTEGIEYNSSEYANKQLEEIITLKAIPNGENKDKYQQYELTKEFKVNITTEPFCFDTELDNTEVEFSDNRAEFDLIIKNSDGTSENVYDTTYKITLENNDKLILYVNGEVTVNNEITKVINIENDVLNIELIPVDGIELDMEEQCKLKIETIGKYLKNESYELLISRDFGISPNVNTEYMTPVKYQNGQWVEANTTVPGEWYDYSYQKWANVVTDNGYFVYIPRFAYKITSGYHETLDTAGTVAIVFLNKDNTLKTTKDSEGNIVDPSDLVTADQVKSSVANTGINATTKYVIHPAFTAFDTDEQNIDGLWVAKYEMSMETTTDGGTTWNHTSVESTTVGNVSIASSTTERIV